MTDAIEFEIFLILVVLVMLGAGILLSGVLDRRRRRRDECRRRRTYSCSLDDFCLGGSGGSVSGRADYDAGTCGGSGGSGVPIQMVIEENYDMAWMVGDKMFLPVQLVKVSHMEMFSHEIQYDRGDGHFCSILVQPTALRSAMTERIADVGSTVPRAAYEAMVARAERAERVSDGLLDMLKGKLT